MSDFIVLEINGDLLSTETEELAGINASIGTSNALIGGDMIVQALVIAITPLVLKVVRDIALARIERGSKISIKTKSIEIKNIDRATLLELLTQLEAKTRRIDA